MDGLGDDGLNGRDDDDVDDGLNGRDDDDDDVEYRCDVEVYWEWGLFARDLSS